jgi:glycosyltransferase involved in cell wall biosynthesis
MRVSQPTIGIVVPTHNRRPLLEAAIQSALVQVDAAFEVVVVDDGSTDDTEDYLNSVGDERLKVVRHPQPKERSAARNAGMSATEAPWLMFVDDDELFAPGGLRALSLAALTSPPDCVAIAGRLGFFADAQQPRLERWIRRPWTGPVLADCVLDPFLGPNRALLRRAEVEAVGGWSIDYPPFEDYLMALRLAARGRATLIPDAVVLRRIHSGQSDLSEAERMHEEILELLSQELAPEQADVVQRRRRALKELFGIHAEPSMPAPARLAAAWRVLRDDPSIVGTPLSRNTVGRMTARVLLSSLIPRRLRRAARRSA